MKLYFKPALDHELQVIEAVCNLLQGQEQYRAEFIVMVPSVTTTPDDLFSGDTPE